MTDPDCWSCRALAGQPRISPGPPIHIGEFWQVEHAYPTQLAGWLVIVARRHVEALHELSAEEFRELSVVLERTIRVLHDILVSEKEYVACYAEQEHFRHVHFHVVPRSVKMPSHLIGARSFAALKIAKTEAVPPDHIRELCESLRAAFESAHELPLEPRA